MGDHNTQKIITSNETRLTVAITDLITFEDLSFNLSQQPRFKKVIYLERNVSKCYQLPNRNIISKDLLGEIHDQNMESNLSLIKEESDIFRLLFICDGATISSILLLNILVSGVNPPLAVWELVDCQGHLADGGGKYGIIIWTRFLEHMQKLILISQSQMLFCFIELQMDILAVKFLKFIIQIFQLCVEFNTLYIYFSMMFPKSHLWIRWLHLIMQYTTYFIMVYITNLIIYSNQNHINFTIGTLVYSVAMIQGWLVIVLEFTEICAWEKHFLPRFLLLNSTLCHSIQNIPK